MLFFSLVGAVGLAGTRVFVPLSSVFFCVWVYYYSFYFLLFDVYWTLTICFALFDTPTFYFANSGYIFFFFVCRLAIALGTSSVIYFVVLGLRFAYSC